MRSALTISAAALIFLTGISSVSASDQIASGPKTSAMGFYFCMAMEDPTPAASKGKVFFSDVFSADGNAINAVRDSYAKFLQEKYSYAQDPSTFSSSIQCTGGNNQEEIAAAEQARMKPGKTMNPDGTFETGWKYSG